MAEISKDVTGHLAEDNKTLLKPLEGKAAREVHAAHNQPGTPIAQQCKCAHCYELRLTIGRAVAAEKKVDPPNPAA